MQQKRGKAKNTNGNNPLRKVPIHFWWTRRFTSVPDYGYLSRLFHPVSPTIFLSLGLSWNACYSITFQPFVQLFRRIVFPNEVPFQSPFLWLFQAADRWKLLLIRRSFRSQYGSYETKVSFCLLTFLNQHLNELLRDHLFCWWTAAFLFWFKLQLFLNANPKIRLIGYGVQLSTLFLFHSFKATFYRSSDDINIRLFLA